MLRGVRIDLRTARDTLDDGLKPIYARDIRAGTLSDEAIASVKTIVRALEGALGQTADAVAASFATHPKVAGKRVRPYFPLANEEPKFDGLFDAQLPGVAKDHPHIREAFKRHQPFQPGREKRGSEGDLG
jgi:hypothetical protein